eukprot:1301488-Lingulodinium_polyedra.AAC.1
MAGLHKGPRRAFRMQFIVLAAGHAASLAVATHSCACVVVSRVAVQALEALGRCPVRIARASQS